MNSIKSYYYFTGETIEGDYLDYSFSEPMTEEAARKWAEEELINCGGGYLDIWRDEDDELTFDVKV